MESLLGAGLEERVGMPGWYRRELSPFTVWSGGQTGVDRASLDAAIDLGIPHGGHCPKGRRAEDGRIPERYRLQEVSSPGYRFRTMVNVLKSSATLILWPGEGRSPGTKLTVILAREYLKPYKEVQLLKTPVQEVVDWINFSVLALPKAILNVAGPHEEEGLHVHDRVYEYLKDVFSQVEGVKR